MSQRPVRVLRAVGQRFDVAAKLLGRAQQAGIDKVEDRPQIAQMVFNRGCGQPNARLFLQRLGGFGLARGGSFDGLRFIKNDQPPRCLGEGGQAQQRAIAGNDEIVPAASPDLPPRHRRAARSPAAYAEAWEWKKPGQICGFRRC